MSYSSNDFQSIRAIVETYVLGMVRGDAGLLNQAFHKDASVIGHFNGKLAWTGVQKFIDATVPLGDGGVLPDLKISNIQLNGDTAVVVCENEWAGLRFDDSLSLMRIDGRWQIVSKVYHQLN